MCYNIRFVELNERDSGDPWSLRQMGVYEKFKFQSRSSKWILLQPSPAALQALEDGLRSRGHDLHSFTNSMSLHTRLLFTSSRQWPDYIDYLRAQLERLVRTSDFRTLYLTHSQSRISKLVIQPLVERGNPIMELSSRIVRRCNAYGGNL